MITAGRVPHDSLAERVAKYAVFFTYTSDTWARMIMNPGDRTAAVRQLADSVGGSLESAYWMFGAHDGIVIVDIPTRSAPPP